MLHNHKISKQSFFELFSLTLPIFNKISTVAIWLAMTYSILSSATSGALSSSPHFQHLLPPVPISTQNATNSTPDSQTFLNPLNDPFSLMTTTRLVTSPLFKILFASVKPVFTCPHTSTTIPILDIDLPETPLGHILCEVQNFSRNKVTTTTLVIVFVIFVIGYSILLLTANYLRQEQQKLEDCNYNNSNCNPVNDQDTKTEMIQKNPKCDQNKQHQLPNQKDTKFAKNHQWKSPIRLAWISLILLFLLTPILVTLSISYSPITILLAVTALLLTTTLTNEYTNLFNRVHLVYSSWEFLNLNDPAFIRNNASTSGYIHIHTHMSREEILERFDHPEKVLLKQEKERQMGMHIGQSIQGGSDGVRDVIDHNNNITTHNNTKNNKTSNSKRIITKTTEKEKNLTISNGYLPFPKTFPTIISMNTIISLLTACGINQYLVLVATKIQNLQFAQNSSRLEPYISALPVVFKTAIQDSLFVFILVSVLLLSLSESMLYLFASIHHSSASLKSLRGENITHDSFDCEESVHHDNSNNNNNNNDTTTDPDLFKKKPSFSLAQYVYFVSSVLLALIAILLLTCHSPLQTFILLALYFTIGVVSPSLLLIFRSLPHSKRVIRGPWDYDDYDEVGKDNI
jgi:hypothetical protein